MLVLDNEPQTRSAEDVLVGHTCSTEDVLVGQHTVYRIAQLMA